MSPRTVIVTILFASLLAFGLTGTARAASLLDNGDLEGWDGQSPAGWGTQGSVSPVSTPSVSGNAARIAGVSFIRQVIPISPGQRYDVSAMVYRPGNTAKAMVEVIWLDTGLMDISGIGAETQGTLVGSFQELTLAGVSTGMPTAAWMQVTIWNMAPESYAIVDNISVEQREPETPTATASATESPTASATPDATVPPTVITPPPSRTPWVIGTPRPRPSTTATPSPTPTARPPRRPNIEQPGARLIPPPVPRSGGMLFNGTFEVVENDIPVAWSRQGGIMSASEHAFRGRFAARLDSQGTTVRWLHQATVVQPGTWYDVRAQGRLLYGRGDVFIRVSWYRSLDASGELFDQTDSNLITDRRWGELTTGAIQAPPGIHSARVRLMYRPTSSGGALFDDVFMEEVEAPTPTPSVTPISSPSATVTPAPGGTPTPVPTASASPSPSSTALPTPTAVATPTTPPATPTPPPTAVPTPAVTPTPTAPPPTPSVAPPLQGPTKTPPPGPSGAQSASAGLVQVTEFMSDPDGEGPDNAAEWVELFNPSGELVEITGWGIADAKGDDAVPAAILAPGAYVVLAAGSAALPADIPVLRVADGIIGNGLNNDGDRIELRGADGGMVDVVLYGNEAGATAPAPGAGETVGRTSAGAWAETLRPTPGWPNEFPAEVPDDETDGQNHDTPPGSRDSGGSGAGGANGSQGSDAATTGGSGDPAVIGAPDLAGGTAGTSDVSLTGGGLPGATPVSAVASRIALDDDDEGVHPIAIALLTVMLTVGAIFAIPLVKRNIPVITVHRRGS